MAVVAAQLIANISVNGASSAAAQIAGVGQAATMTQNQLRGMILGGVAIAGAALIGAGAAAVKMAGDFQSGIATLATGAGESQKNLQMVSDGILKMAPQVGTSTKQLVDGMYMIESAGFHGAAGLSVLKASAEGAKVGNAKLADVANGVTTMLTDYAKSGITAAQATNTLIATVAAGKTHMAELSRAMSTILPTSAAVGVSLTDTSAALATMTGQGTSAASAATYLRQLLMALESPAKKGATALKEIGLSTADVSAEMKKSLPGTLQLITDHLKQKFPEGSAAYVAALKDIAGGSKQMQGILELTGAHLKTFKDNVTGITGAVKAGGDSITGWSLVQQNFNQKMDQAKAAVEVMMIRIGQGLLPVLGQLLGAVTPLLSKFSDWVAGGNRLKEFLDSSTPQMLLLKAGIIALAGAIGGIMVSALVAFTVAAWAALVPMLPFIAIGAAVALVIAGIVLAITHWGQIVDWLKSVWGGISAWFAGLWKEVQAIFEAALAAIVAVVIAGGQLILDSFLAPIKNIVVAFQWLYDHNYYFKDLVDFIVRVTSSAMSWLQGAWRNTVSWLAGVWNVLVSTASAIWGSLAGVAQRAWSAVASVFSSAWGMISGALSSLWSGISGWFGNLASQAFKWGANIIQGIVNGIGSMLGAVGQAASNVASTVAKFLGFHSPTELGPGRDLDLWGPNMVKGFAEGIKRAAPTLQTQLSLLVQPMTMLSQPPAFPPPRLAGTATPAQTIVVQPAPVTIDGRVLATALMPYIASQIRYNTGARI